MSTTIEPGAEPGHAIFDIEPVLHDMQAATAMLGHMATSDTDVTADHLHFVESRLIECHRKLEVFWQQAWDDMKAEHAQHAAELAEAKAKAAESAPGSIRQIKQAQGMLTILRAGHRAALDQCEEIGNAITEALAEREAQS